MSGSSFPQARENEQDDAGTLDSAVGSGSLAESTSLNMEVLAQRHNKAPTAVEIQSLYKIHVKAWTLSIVL